MRTIILSSLFILFALKSLAQADSVNEASGSSNHALYSGLGYGSNMIYLGSTISGNQPYGYAAVTYGFRNELFATVTSVHLTGLSPFISFTSGTINWTHTFNSWFDMTAGISGYKVAPSVVDTLFNNFYYGSISLGFDWKLLYTTITGGILFSSETRSYLQVKNSRYFQTPEFFKKKFYVSFDPYFNILLGTMTKAETIEGTTTILSPPFRKRGQNKLPVVSGTEYTDFFSLMEMDFGIPVDFNAGRFTIEAEPSYILSFYEDSLYPGPKGFIFMLSCYFRIF
jgi:hypothetical protein